MDEKIVKKILSFKDLKVWQESIELVKETYKICSFFPKEEVYGLSSQMKRAAVSISSNIAEGHSRQHRTEFRQFVFIAVGSLAELETQLLIAIELNFLKGLESNPITERIARLRAMLLLLGKKL